MMRELEDVNFADDDKNLEKGAQDPKRGGEGKGDETERKRKGRDAVGKILIIIIIIIIIMKEDK